MQDDRVVAPGFLDVGDVLRETFRAATANAGPFSAVAAIVVVPGTVLGVLLNVLISWATESLVESPNPDPEDMIGIAAAVLVGYALLMLVYVAGYAVAQASIMYGTVEFMAGRRAGMGDALRVAFDRVFALIGTALLQGVILVFGFLCCLVPGILALIWLALALPACTVEKLGPIQSLQRSVDLTEGHRMTIFLTFLVLWAVSVALSMCILGPAMIAAGAGAAGAGIDVTSPLSPVQLITNLFQAVIGVAQLVVFSSLVAVIYARLRGIRDGVDAAALANVFT
jgi:hypothetical protein